MSRDSHLFRTVLCALNFVCCLLPVLAGPLPASRLFDADWHDRQLFLGDLLPEAQADALTLEDASIYHLELSLDEALTTVEGRQEVFYTNRGDRSLDELVFQLFPNLLGGNLEIQGVRVNDQEVAPSYLEGRTALRVPLPLILPVDSSVVIALDFRLRVPEDISRNFGILAFRNGVLSLAHAYPLLAVYGEDGWDLDPPSPHGDLLFAESSFYRVRVSAPAGLVVVTSGRQVDRRLEGQRQVLTFAAGPVRDFFLAASFDYHLQSRTVGGTVVRSYSLAGERRSAERALGYAVAALDIFSARFGGYPYRELDLVPIATSALGVEFPGIVAIADALEGQGSDGGPLLEGTTVHEVAHQWFYGLVGNDQVTEPWLDESLAQYATSLYFRDRYGERAYQGFRQSLQERWESVGRREMPIGLAAGEYTPREYGAIVYGLGPLVLELLAERLGEGVFTAFLRGYVTEFTYGNATTADFEALAEESCACDLGDFFARWVGP